MKLSKSGKNTSSVSVENITPSGLWILINEKEFFLNYRDFPWFLNRPIKDIFNVERPAQNHLYWPKLDVDLELDSLLRPQNYPLIAA